MHRLILPLLWIAVTLVGCGQQKFDAHAYLQDGALGFYRVTNQQASDVGQPCGVVSSGNDPLQMSGWWSNALPSGTKLFLVSNESISKEVAVQLQDGQYVLAMYVGNTKP